MCPFRLCQTVSIRTRRLPLSASRRKLPGKRCFEEGEFGDDSAKLMYLERERDFLRLHDKPGCRFLLACEVESGANYEMPVRCFTYDSIEYTDQLKEWKRKSQQMFWGRGKRGKKRRRIRRPLLPVISSGIILGEKRWKSKLKLQEMIGHPGKL